MYFGIINIIILKPESQVIHLMLDELIFKHRTTMYISWGFSNHFCTVFVLN